MRPLSQHQTQSQLDSEPLFSIVRGLIGAGETNASIARILIQGHGCDTTKDSIRRFRKRHGFQVPNAEPEYTRIKGDNAEACTKPRADAHSVHDKPRPVLDDPDKMLLDRGLDPEEWYIPDGNSGGIQLNQWDGPHTDGNIVTYYQAKFTARRRRPHEGIMPVRSDGWRPPRKPAIRVARTGDDPSLVVVCGDSQAPFHDRRLHELFLEFLRDQKPVRGVDLGDLTDQPGTSRHKKDVLNDAHVNECTQEGYDILRGRLEASPYTEWEWLPGNHDIRLWDYVQANAPEVATLKRVDTPESVGEMVHKLEHVMRLDELGVKFHDPHGSYEDAQVNLSKNIAVRHGWIARAGGGRSALETLKATGFSILVGHTHRQSIVQHTAYEIDGTPRQLLGAEIGCMCRIDKRGELDEKGRRWPNYTTLPDWQQGFATVAIYPDGKFKVDLASYVNGVLLWRDKRYE